jgi:hypothetical protein
MSRLHNTDVPDLYLVNYWSLMEEPDLRGGRFRVTGVIACAGDSGCQRDLSQLNIWLWCGSNAESQRAACQRPVLGSRAVQPSSAQPCPEFLQPRNGRSEPPRFDLRLFVRRTHRHGCRQHSLADIDSRIPLRYYRDHDHTGPFCAERAAGVPQPHVASRAQSTIPGSLSAGRTSLKNGVYQQGLAMLRPADKGNGGDWQRKILLFIETNPRNTVKCRFTAK